MSQLYFKHWRYGGECYRQNPCFPVYIVTQGGGGDKYTNKQDAELPFSGAQVG